MSKTYHRNFEGYLVEGDADFSVDNHGSIVLLRALTPAAEGWIEEHVGGEETQHFAGATVVEPRYIGSIIEALQAEGLEGSVV